MADQATVPTPPVPAVHTELIVHSPEPVPFDPPARWALRVDRDFLRAMDRLTRVGLTHDQAILAIAVLWGEELA